MRNNNGAETETVPAVAGMTIDGVKGGRTRKELLAGCVTSEDWLAAGFISIPRTKSEVRLATAARECLEALSCFSEVRQRLASGEKFTQIAAHILDVEVPPPPVKSTTLVKYLASFHRHFIESPSSSDGLDHHQTIMDQPAQRR